MAARKPKAPTGCYWRGDTIWGRRQVNGRDLRWSLHTGDPAVAKQRHKAGIDRALSDAHHSDAKRSFVEALEAWAPWIERQVGPKTCTRYACSLDQLEPHLTGKLIADITGRVVAEIITARRLAGVTEATIKRDLGALSSVMNFCVLQEWVDSNPVLPKLKGVKERRDPIVLPTRADVDLVVGRAPGMIKDLIRAAVATGARETALLTAERPQLDHERKQLTLIGKGNKLQVIDLAPFGGYDLFRSLPAFVGSPLLFWHGNGESYKNFASQFSAIVERTAAFAEAAGFRPFRFHDLRHLHAVEWLKSGRSIYDLQKRLAHTSIKVTEGYLQYLTPDEERIVKSGSPAGATPAQKPAQSRRAGTR
jgi:integrase/recombinase XerD